MLPRSTAAAEDFAWGRQRFIDEGRTLANLHEAPSIVKVFDFLEENGTAYIVMELLRGETLEQRVRSSGSFTPEQIDALLWPLRAGLEQVHEAGFLHRDIKPANILLGAEGRPTLIDFGASRVAMADRTATMTAVFTPGYAAPEQFSSTNQGPWTDIYGLAATLYFAITGAPPPNLITHHAPQRKKVVPSGCPSATTGALEGPSPPAPTHSIWHQRASGRIWVIRPPNAIDRMMDDRLQGLGQGARPGFALGLLVGIDAGLTLSARDRPQGIAAWRTMLARPTADSDPTLVMRKRPSRRREAPPVKSAPRRRRSIGFAGIVAIVLLGVGANHLLSYRATVSRNGADTLLIEGCVLFVCQKQVWWKASVLAEALR